MADGSRRRRDAFDLVPLQLARDALLDLVEHLGLVGQDEREGHAVVPHPAGPADPVDVVRRVVGQVEVDDVRDAADVDPAADDVGGDQGREPARAERVRDPVALGLAEVAVHRLGPHGLRCGAGRRPGRPRAWSGRRRSPASAARAGGA